MIVGEHSRANDLEVNPVRPKKLTNMRASGTFNYELQRKPRVGLTVVHISGTDEAVRLAPPVVFPLEEIITYVGPDELVEVTPNNIRMRKLLLSAQDRKIRARNSKKAKE